MPAKTKAKPFDFSFLSADDLNFVSDALGGVLREPDLTIALDGNSPAYLYRWHVIPRNEKANTYLHIQVANDPERPLHDHPWDNMSVIISGGYDELLQALPWPGGYVETKKRRPGHVVFRQAAQPHRLLLAPGVPYTISLFSTGPKVKEWGFWCEVHGRQTWLEHAACVSFENGRSVWTGPISLNK